MTRRPSRALARRFALALSLMLVAGALTVPAFASSHTTDSVEILSPLDGGTVAGNTLYLRASTTIDDATLLDAEDPVRSGSWIAWAVRSPVVDGSEGPCSGDGNNIAGDTGRDVFDGTKSFENGVFTAEVDISAVTEDAACFVFRVVNNEDARATVTFTISDALDEFDDVDEVEQCDVGDRDCEITQEGFTASTDARGKDGGTAFLGLRLVDDNEYGSLAQAVSEACETAALEVNPSARLGPDVVQLVPINFADGSITVRSTIPKDFVNAETARGAGIFQVCVAAEAGDYAGFSLSPLLDGDGNETGLFGPVILDDCDEFSTAEDACVVDKSKSRGNVVLTYQLPTKDPWLK